MNHFIDLRSDTVTKPTPEMLAAMTQADIGDDVFGEDPTVSRLEEEMAGRVGMENGLFATSGTQSNLIGLMAHCERGDEYIAGQQAHLYRWEGGGASVLGGIQAQPIEFEPDGTLNLHQVERSIKPNEDYHVKTKLLCLENTQAGKVLSLSYLKSARQFVDIHGLRFHLDGARVFNAAVKLNVDILEITQHFHSVSICLSKGLGAPVGSVLCGPKDFIKRARRWRKVVGGGMRQAGILAAAGLHAIRHHVNRLAEDHENAFRLAQGLSQIQEMRVNLDQVQTNMVFVDLNDLNPDSISSYLKGRGIKVPCSRTLRLVTHLDLSRKDIEFTIDRFKEAIRNSR